MKTIIVTGGSRGIGEAIVKKMAERGYNVVLDYNKSEEKAKNIQAELKEKGYDVEIFKADVSKREEVKALIAYTLEKFGTIDVLINNAGIDQEKMIQDITDEEFHEVINTNLYSVYCTIQEVLPTFLKNKSGCIINISSIYAISGGSCASIYSASKAGIDGITKSLAKELGPSNIRINSIAPGCMNTDMNAYLSKEEWDEIKEETPLRRVGEGIDIARCVAWLVEDEFTTGQVISINGGFVI